MDAKKIEEVPFEEVYEVEKYGTYYSENKFWQKVQRVAKKVGATVEKCGRHYRQPCRLNKAGPARPRKKARPPPGWEHRPAGKTARKKRAARSFGRPDSLSKKVTGRWPFFSYRGKECSVMV